MKEKRYLVIGLGISGRSAAELLLKKGAQVAAVDQNRHLLDHNVDIQVLKQRGLKTFSDPSQLEIKDYHTVVVSPGVPQSHPLYVQAKELKIEMLGEVELACQFLKAPAFLGITGTNGKTTVTLLVAHILNAAGMPARALGNVGVAMTSEKALEAASANEIIVAELSSYQLETLHSKVLDAAVLLNITPDHLDRYGTMEHYAIAKMHISKCLKPEGPLYIEEQCLKEYGYLLKDFKAKSYGYQSHCDLHTDLKAVYNGENALFPLPQLLHGHKSHDLENIMAAYALCQQMGVTPELFLNGLSTFKKPPHRIEFVCQVKGVDYIDDSKGTNLDAVIRAVETIQKPIILIGGGVDKGAPYSPWIAAFAGKVKSICAIGQAASKIEKDLNHAIPVGIHQSLEEAVRAASKMAKSGDVILLSPGCSSFDMFRDYAHRGEEFQRIANALKLEEGKNE